MIFFAFITTQKSVWIPSKTKEAFKAGRLTFRFIFFFTNRKSVVILSF